MLIGDRQSKVADEGANSKAQSHRVEVSVVMPAHNSAHYIDVAIESVIAQDFVDWELIVVDDASTDDTVDVVRSIVSRDERIRLISSPQCSGPAVARNRAISVARGRYIAFLDSDDRWLPTKLSRQVNFMRLHGVAFTFTSYYRVDEGGRRLGVVNVPLRVSHRRLLKSNSIGCLTAMYDAGALGLVEMPMIRKGQDFAMWLSLLRMTDAAFGIREPLAEYRVRSDSISSRKFESARWVWQVLHDVEGLSTARAAYNFGFYAVNGVVDKVSQRLQEVNDELMRRKTSREVVEKESGPAYFDKCGEAPVKSSFARVAERLDGMVSRLSERGLAFPFTYFKEVLAFDLRWRTDTAGRQFNAGDHDDNVHYVASFTSTVKETLARTRLILGDQFDELQFVDIGCGKGKALAIYLMVYGEGSSYPPVGIEYDDALCAVTRRNLLTLGYLASEAAIISDTALNIRAHIGERIPLYFLFNPFEGELFRAFLDSIDATAHMIIYVDPVEERELVSRGYALQARSEGRYHSDTWIIVSSPGFRSEGSQTS